MGGSKMSVASGDFGSSWPNKTYGSCICAFLCDHDGQIIRDFGELLPNSNESMSALSLIGLMESGSFMDFLQTIRKRGATSASEVGVSYPGSATGLLFKGSQTPGGILVFATLTVDPAVSEQDRPAHSAGVTDVTKPLPADNPSSRQSDVGATLAAIIKQQADILELLSTVIHDLKNPASSIISACEYLTEYSLENLHPDQLALIDGIESSARDLLQIPGRLSDLCKLKSQLAVNDLNTNAEHGVCPVDEVSRTSG